MLKSIPFDIPIFKERHLLGRACLHREYRSPKVRVSVNLYHMHKPTGCLHIRGLTVMCCRLVWYSVPGYSMLL